MSINKNIFPSKSERSNYYKLLKNWSNKFNIYSNVPFLMVFNINKLNDQYENKVVLDNIETSRLKKTSIDYTICDKNDKPIICIEFDGLQEGYNSGEKYITPNNDTNISSDDPWRKIITELKLKIAKLDNFPYLILGSRYFNYLSPEEELMIVDTIIGQILTNIDKNEKINENLPFEEKFGLSEEEYNNLTEFEKSEFMQDWVLGVETEAEFSNNPLIDIIMTLQNNLPQKSFSIRNIFPKEIDGLKIFGERMDAINNMTYEIIECIINTESYGQIKSNLWLPKFNINSYSSIGGEIVHYLALKKLEKKLNKEN